MASKYKITAYTSDTLLYEWAEEAAKKKKMTKSEYLESLIREEMHRQKTAAGEPSSRLKPQFTIFETFTPRGQVLNAYSNENLDVNVEALKSSLANENLDANDERLMQNVIHPGDRTKNFMSWLGIHIQKSIYADFWHDVSGKYIHLPDCDYHIVFLKLCFRGSLNKDNRKKLYCNYQITYLPLIITEDLWDKFEGRYDFFNIQYLPQKKVIGRKISRVFADKYTGGAFIFEKQHQHEDLDGFYVPVLRNPVSLEQRLTCPILMKKLSGGNYFFTGVNERNRKERFSLVGLELIRQL